MDVLNEKDIFDRIVSPAIEKINRETVPALEAVIQRQVAAAKSEIAALVADAALVAQGLADKLVADLGRTIDERVQQLDGLRLVDEIRIPPVEVRFKGGSGGQR